MKKNKGFTLIELLTIIIILAIIIIIPSVSILNSIESNKEKTARGLVETLETAAKTYVYTKDDALNTIDTIGYYDVSINTLISKGYILNLVKNPYTKVDVPTSTNIRVSKNSDGILIVNFDLVEIDVGKYLNK